MNVINTFTQLFDFNGKAIPGEEGKPFTLGQFLISVLNNTPKEKNFPPMKAYDLASRLYKENFVELDKADFIKLKTLVEDATNFSTLFVGQVLTLLEDDVVVHKNKK